jgi:hypothetical protein
MGSKLEEDRGARAATAPPTAPPAGATAPGRRLSLDWWAVIASLALAVLVRSGAIQKIPW